MAFSGLKIPYGYDRPQICRPALASPRMLASAYRGAMPLDCQPQCVLGLKPNVDKAPTLVGFDIFRVDTYCPIIVCDRFERAGRDVPWRLDYWATSGLIRMPRSASSRGQELSPMLRAFSLRIVRNQGHLFNVFEFLERAIRYGRVRTCQFDQCLRGAFDQRICRRRLL